MISVGVNEIRSRLAEIIRTVESGETVVLTRHQSPFAELRPLPQPTKTRQLGFLAGWLEVPEGAFAPMTEEELSDWDGV